MAIDRHYCTLLLLLGPLELDVAQRELLGTEPGPCAKNSARTSDMCATVGAMKDAAAPGAVWRCTAARYSASWCRRVTAAKSDVIKVQDIVRHSIKVSLSLILPLFPTELCLYHSSESTTIRPRCAPGQRDPECNTTDSNVIIPRVAEMRSKCPSSMESYCLNGDCVYIARENLHYCRCTKGYTGARCMHFELVQQPMSKEDVALTVAVVVFVLAGLLIASYLIYRRCRKNRSKNQTQYVGVGRNPGKTECKELFLVVGTLPPDTTLQNLL
uniref:uncharacterized protein n=1 Tax=Pristiophorus japonicus TaxID=55135 RepID=UPI00398ECD1D